jgi:GMP synthase (glutamine-hydrolysing)
MKRVLVFKHIQNENLGFLKPILSGLGIAIKYVNFSRDPEANPNLEKVDALIVLGGWMGVYEMDRYPHLKKECQLIELALKKDIPILGICLGSQMLAHTLGASVKKHSVTEAGWCEIEATDLGEKDPLFSHFRKPEIVFQMHGDTFDLPSGSTNLVRSHLCENQAFRWKNSYGLQFHLEADLSMITTFIHSDEHREALKASGGCPDRLKIGIEKHLARQANLAEITFGNFFQDLGAVKYSTHGKPKTIR